ncbi:unnamed protein product [Ambrosiozyma monospora]|uniref:Unnamed protein product n=1 Tax=Ambrosiozyma monospora TaxID=43982 RepID=A0ACB5TPZ7_AMBMO|nr:unnamed protein product [Ambrosiozyma monospora]
MKNNRVLVDDIKSQEKDIQLQQQANREQQDNNWRTPTGLEYPSTAMQTELNPSVGYTSDSGIAILPSSLPQIHRAFMLQSFPELAGIQPISTKKSKTRWHFGIRSRSYPLDVMGEIYRALKNLGAEWTRPSEEELWTIKVRWKYCPVSVPDGAVDQEMGQGNGDAEDGGIEQKNVAVSCVRADLMKMQIQLFQLEPNNYLVDFKFDGWESNDQHDKDEDEISSFSAYPFLHLATRLIMELAVNSQG